MSAVLFYPEVMINQNETKPKNAYDTVLMFVISIFTLGIWIVFAVHKELWLKKTDDHDSVAQRTLHSALDASLGG